MKLPRLLLHTLLVVGSLGIFAADAAVASSPPPPTYPIAVSCGGIKGTWQRAYKIHLVYYYNGTNIYDHWATDGPGLSTNSTGKNWLKGGTLRITATMFYQSTGAQCGSYDRSFTFNGSGGAIQIAEPNPIAASTNPFTVNAPFMTMNWGSFMGVDFQ
jgi:hypothetical protein